jgi:hypothetical protein
MPKKEPSSGKTHRDTPEGSPKKIQVKSAFLAEMRRGFTRSGMNHHAETRSLQPANRWVENLSLQIKFCERVREKHPEIITDLFLRIFEVLSLHSNLLKGYSDFRSKCDPIINERSWRGSVPLVGTSPHFFQDVSGLISLKTGVLNSVREWSKQHRMEAEWFQEFALSTFDLFWRWAHIGSSNISFESPPLLANFCIKFLNNQHLYAWELILYEKRQQSAKKFSYWDVNEPKLPTEVDQSTHIKQPIPLMGFPDRWDGHELMEKPEYELRVRSYVERQFMLRIGDFGVDYEMIGGWVLEWMKLIGQGLVDKYWSDFDDFLKKKGWIAVKGYRELDRDIDWVVMHHCGRLEFKDISAHYQSHYEQAHTIDTIKIAITKMEEAFNLKSPRKRGGSRPGTRRRNTKARPAKQASSKEN